MTTARLQKQIAAANAARRAEEAIILADRYRIAVAAHRSAAYGIAQKVTGSPSFGSLDDSALAEYERCRIELLEIEEEMRKARKAIGLAY